MRTNIKILGAVAVAGVVAVTGSAFTASNTVAEGKKFGFGSTAVTGVVTTAMSFGAVVDDASEVSAVDYTLHATETAVSEANATAVIKYGQSTAALNEATCAIVSSIVDGAAGSIKCALPADTAVTSLNVIQLVVTPQADANNA